MKNREQGRGSVVAWQGVLSADHRVRLPLMVAALMVLGAGARLGLANTWMISSGFLQTDSQSHEQSNQQARQQTDQPETPIASEPIGDAPVFARTLELAHAPGTRLPETDARKSDAHSPAIIFDPTATRHVTNFTMLATQRSAPRPATTRFKTQPTTAVPAALRSDCFVWPAAAVRPIAVFPASEG